MLYLLKFYKIAKIGGTSCPFPFMEWPGIQIPQAVLKLLGTKVIRFHFIADKGSWEEYLIHFYERNMAGRELDFDDSMMINHTS